MIDGILIVDKEVGISSYDVIRRVKRILGKRQKIGHAGTLDPFASGVLILLFGKATKLMSTFLTYEKVYEAVAEFGFTTDTQDITGAIVNRDEKGKKTTKEEMQELIEGKFLGDIQQIPPIYSAKRIKGQRAYKLAREEKEVELKPRSIHISQFEIYEYEFPIFKAKIRCSSGTYIRTLIHDLAISLGTYATIKELKRTSIGDFKVKESIKSENILEMSEEQIERRIINL